MLPKATGASSRTPPRSSGSTCPARCARWAGVRTAAELVAAGGPVDDRRRHPSRRRSSRRTAPPTPPRPLVVLLHGRGSHEREILALAPHLPDGAAYAAVRAPIAEGGGYAWFANRGIGRPVAESLARHDGLVPRLARRRRARRAARSSWSGSAEAPPSPAGWCSPTRPGSPAPRSSTAPCPSTPASRSTPAGSPACPCSSPRATPTTVIPRELLDRTWHYLLDRLRRAGRAHARPGRPRHHRHHPRRARRLDRRAARRRPGPDRLTANRPGQPTVEARVKLGGRLRPSRPPSPDHDRRGVRVAADHVGMTLASATRRLRMPFTRSWASTTSPIRHVEVRWYTVRSSPPRDPRGARRWVPRRRRDRGPRRGPAGPSAPRPAGAGPVATTSSARRMTATITFMSWGSAR